MKIIIANLSPSSEHNIKSKIFKKKLSMLHFPLGLGIISAVLNKAGREFDTYDSYTYGTTEDFFKKIDDEKYPVILLSGYLGNYAYSFLKNIASKAKGLNSLCKIIIGGPIASAIPALLVSKTHIDVAVIGEGENTIIELLDAIEKRKDLFSIKGICFRDSSGKANFTPPRERIKDLDEYPFPLYEAFNVKLYIEYLKETNRLWEISASRGCYRNCRFCKLTFGKQITNYSAKYILNHMLYVYKKYGINGFNFVDDNFLSNIKKCEEFLYVLRDSSVKFKWRFQTRADFISPDLVEKMTKVGLFDVSFGIESGSQAMLERYDKRLDLKKAFSILKAIKEMVDIHATFIVGGPGENWDTVRETESFIRKLKLKNANIGILTLFPGTYFYNEAVRAEIIKDEEEYCMNLGPVYDYPYTNISGLSDRDLIKARDILEQTAAEFGEYT